LLKRKITISLLLFAVLLSLGWLGNAELAERYSQSLLTDTPVRLYTEEKAVKIYPRTSFSPREYVRIIPVKPGPAAPSP